jgi:hypothetical protein
MTSIIQNVINSCYTEVTLQVDHCMMWPIIWITIRMQRLIDFQVYEMTNVRVSSFSTVPEKSVYRSVMINVGLRNILLHSCACSKQDVAHKLGLKLWSLDKSLLLWTDHQVNSRKIRSWSAHSLVCIDLLHWNMLYSFSYYIYFCGLHQHIRIWAAYYQILPHTKEVQTNFSVFYY